MAKKRGPQEPKPVAPAMVPAPRRPWLTPRRVLAATLVAVAGLAAFSYWTSRTLPTEPVADPRLGFASPFKNIHPNIRYVGSESCAGCHPDIARSFKQHPMGRSLEPMERRTAVESFAAASRNPFDQLGLRFTTEKRGDTYFQRLESLNPDGTPALADEEPLRFGIGSGRRARSYFTAADGYLHQAPIAWYANLNGWGLSPGYEQKNMRFSRKVDQRCLFCHTNSVEPEPPAVNRYREPIFRGHAIGCERCHGPGELHLARLEAEKPVEGAFDDTIVNGKHLPPDLAEAVCQQCHLEGEVRTLRRGREAFDYRPGLPLHPFWAVFNTAAEEGGPKFVGHVEQLHLSRCWTATAGALRCTSCHDPHTLPAPAEKVAYYRAKCAACHTGEPNRPKCAQPEAERLKLSPADDCVQCHMPKQKSSTVFHASITDHRIVRKPGADRRTARRPDDGALINFFRDEPDQRLYPAEERQRDLGIAFMEVVGLDEGGTPQHRHAARLAAEQARRHLDAALDRHPDDVAAREARIAAHAAAGRHAEALADAELGLRYVPDHEVLLAAAGWAADALGDHRTADRRYAQAQKVNPKDAEFAAGRARALLQLDRVAEAEAAVKLALTLDPLSAKVRQTWVAILLQQGRAAEAEAEFAKLLTLKPPDEAGLKAWFAAKRR